MKITLTRVMSSIRIPIYVGALLLLLFFNTFLYASQVVPISELLQSVRSNITRDFKQADIEFAEIEKRQDELTSEQLIQYFLYKASYLGLNGKHAERAELVRGVLASRNPQVNDRVKLLYQQSDSYIKLGEYEKALRNMNESLQLLSRVTDLNAKVSILQGAVTLMLSLGAFDEAMNYAVRMHKLGISESNNNYVCEALANVIDIKFKSGNYVIEQQEIDAVFKICDASDFIFIGNLMRAAAASHYIKMGEIERGIEMANQAFDLLKATALSSDYGRRLHVSLGDAYLSQGKYELAYKHAYTGFEQATANRVPDIIKSASLTLAKILRAQDEPAKALDYYDIYIREQESAELDTIAKNLAYQRVKYENLDKTNQLELMKVKNSSLSLTHKLQQRNNENLILVVSLGTVLLVFMSILLVLSFKRKQALLYEHPLDAANDLMVRDGRALVKDIALESQQKECHFVVMLFELDFMAQFETLLDEQSCQVLLDMVSNACISQLRQGDQFGRIEETRFVLCLLEASHKGAKALATRCQQMIAEIELEDEAIPSPITTTFGIAMLDEASCDYDEALVKADKALSLAKEQGHNSIYVYNLEEEENDD